jgi:alginate O-acetyltransferase complex protein AlgI
MLLTSSSFILCFLPATLLVFWFLATRFHPRLLIFWLVLVSLVFYGWSQATYLPVIVGSIVLNYGLGYFLARPDHRYGRALLFAGVVANLLVLAHFKYRAFFAHIVNSVFGSGVHIASADISNIPLGISFLTFVQIGYLVDRYKAQTASNNFWHYCLFISFFPKLLAGPIVRYSELAPQFARVTPKSTDVAEGFTLFAIGLFKKVILADSLGHYVNPVFDAAAGGEAPALFQAWGAVVGYTFELYFDFSGYSDMAIGIAQMFCIVLPQNFASPYKADSIIEFWRRWHITFSRFLRDYLYIPLGGNRRGSLCQYMNLVTTMVLGGLWHGANWTFIVWGFLHGIYLAINHAWKKSKLVCPVPCAWALTFLAVCMAWVWFRADTFSTGLRMTGSLFGFNGVELNSTSFLRSLNTPSPDYRPIVDVFDDLQAFVVLGKWTMYPAHILLSTVTLNLLLLITSAMIVFLLPSSAEWLEQGREMGGWPRRRAVLVGTMLYIVAISSVTVDTSAFVYFRF